MQNTKGFTLIELVIVIVILGILSATALPRFIDLKADAADAAVKGAAGALASASSINYAAFVVNSTKPGVVRVSTATGASAVAAGMAGWDTNKFTISAEAACNGSTAGQTASATVQSRDDSSKTATATIICTG